MIKFLFGIVVGAFLSIYGTLRLMFSIDEVVVGLGKAVDRKTEEALASFKKNINSDRIGYNPSHGQPDPEGFPFSVYFNEFEDAKRVIRAMQNLCETRGFVTIAHMRILAHDADEGHPSSAYNARGWKHWVEGIITETNGGGWVLALPSPVDLKSS